MDTLKIVGIFVLNVCVGTLLLVVVSLAAVALHFFTEWLAAVGTPTHITYPMGLLAYFVFALDFVSFVVFCLAETYRLLREISLSVGWLRHEES